MRGAIGKLLSGCLLAAGLIAGGASGAEPVLHQPRASQATAPPRLAPGPTSFVEDGRECTVITFEGVGNLAPIPVFDGISSPGWLGIIDADAGGTGNFAQEPSPETIAFWLGGDPGSRDIVMATPASKVEFFYASFVGVTMQALDDTGAVVATASGPPNFNGGTGDPTGQFNKWDPLHVETTGNKIKTIRVTGNTNQTGIDNLKVCTTLGLAAAEMTQAIQQYEDLVPMKARLAATREPLVPLVAGKPGVFRLYMNKVTAVTTLTVRLSGFANGVLTMPLQPNCTVEDQRRQRNGCRSFDFYLTPPPGNWNLRVEVQDSTGRTLETHDFPLRSRSTDKLTLRAVSVCDTRDTNGAWQCAPASALSTRAGLLRKIAPTANVRVAVTGNVIRRDTRAYADVTNWWIDTVRDTNNLFGFFDWLAGIGGDHRTYYGMVRSNIAGGIGGIAHDIPSHAAISRVNTIRLGVDAAHEVVAHEVGHTLGLRHTNTAVPLAATPPGCYNLAADPSTDWPFPDNRIQSAARLEVGFDVAARRPLQPETTFDVMSYCVPRWISPLRYKRALTALRGGAVSTPSVTDDEVPPQRALVTGDFWTVSGKIEGGVAVLDPLFTEPATGPDDAGTGTYRMEVQDAGGAVLFTRHFTPSAAQTESAAEEASGPPAFFELLPVQPAAARIVLFDPNGAAIGSLVFGGIAPDVALLQPAGGATLTGQQTVAWQVTDPDSTDFTAKVYYAADGRAWMQLAQVDGASSVAIDADTLPGAAGTARIKVVVSDGVNTGSTLSEPLTVPKKVPQDVQILAPEPGLAVAQGVLVQFEGSAYDVDDGLLDGDAIVWQSNLNGELGTGAVLATTTLSRGTHTITMTATDSDGNSATATTTVRVAGAPPALTLVVTPLDTLPTTCMEASIVVQPDTGGVGLALAEYSLDGGSSWTQIPLNRLPFKFIVPGSGFVHLIVRVFDEAGQLAVRDQKFFVDSACAVSGSPRLDGHVAAQGSAAPGVMFVDVVVRNGGQGPARAVHLDSVLPRTLAGMGTVTLDTTRSPVLPLALPDLDPGASATVRLYFNVPATVRRFAIVENGGLADIFGRTFKFSINQSVLP
jgi:hypothetical protein